MLKYAVNDLSEVEDALHGLYTEQDGVYVLNVEGVKPEAEMEKVLGALSKERNANKEAQKKLKQFGDVTPDDFNHLSDRVAELQAKDSKDVDALIKARMMPFEREKEQLAQERDNAMTELSELRSNLMNSKRDTAIADMAAGKIKPEFMKDAKLRAKYELQYNDDINGFVDSEGLKAEDWFTKQILETPSWELDSHGAGVKGGTKAKNTVSNNPFVTGNLTEQFSLMKSNPQLAEKLKAQANG